MIYIGTREYKYRRMLMSHMIGDSIIELHQMADKLGIDRKHFQNNKNKPHYDVCKKNKIKALNLGAIMINDRKIINKLKKMKRVVILDADDWTAIYVDGSCIHQGHDLWEGGNGRYLNMLKWSERHNFTSDNVKVVYVDSEIQEWLEDCGSFPENITDIPFEVENM